MIVVSTKNGRALVHTDQIRNVTVTPINSGVMSERQVLRNKHLQCFDLNNKFDTLAEALQNNADSLCFQPPLLLVIKTTLVI